MRRLTLTFDEFGWQALEAEARLEGGSLDGLLTNVTNYLGSTLTTARTATLAPQFKPGGGGTPRAVEIALAPVCWERLEAEAGEQGVSFERFIEHAAMLYLADLDSGAIAARVAERASARKAG